MTRGRDLIGRETSRKVTQARADRKNMPNAQSHGSFAVGPLHYDDHSQARKAGSACAAARNTTIVSLGLGSPRIHGVVDDDIGKKRRSAEDHSRHPRLTAGTLRVSAPKLRSRCTRVDPCR